MSDYRDYKVFISSTSQDLQRYRERVIHFLRQLGLDCIAMEEFTPSERSALQICYDRLRNANVFVGIYAFRYGYVPDSGVVYTTDGGERRSGNGKVGVTEWEYQWATADFKMPLRLFIVKDGVADDVLIREADVNPRLEDFKQRLRHNHLTGFFSSPDDLAAQVLAAIGSLLLETRPRARRNFLPVSLPVNYVPRAELMAQLRLALLGDPAGPALSDKVGPRSAAALHGLGGIGKSVMARALCDDAAVQAAFPDGILFAELGHAPTEADVTRKLRDWVVTLGGTADEIAPTADLMKSRLVDLLKDRAYLLIIDDVWKRGELESFRVGGSRCGLLITTRDAAIAISVGGPVQTIPVLAQSEALELLHRWAAGHLDGVDEDLKLRIVTRLGFLALAIKLAGAQLQKKPAREWLANFHIGRLASDDIETVHDSLERTFGLSLDALPPIKRKLYSALAIFRADEPLAEAPVVRLWGELGDLDAPAAGELADYLAAKALFDIGEREPPRQIVIHDLLRDFMRAALGREAEHVHRTLLAAYLRSSTERTWNTVPDDGYLYDHLAYHLRALNDREGIAGLFVGTAWLRARVAQSGYTYDKYIDDLNVAWREFAEPEALRQTGSGAEPVAFLDCVRYALIRTSVNGLAGSYAPAQVAQAVQVGIWTPDRALRIVARIADKLENRSKIAAYAALLATGRLDERQRTEAQRGGLDAAFDIARRGGYPDFEALAIHLDQPSLHESVEKAMALADHGARAHALSAFLVHLPAAERGRVIPAALEAGLNTEDPYDQARVMRQIAPSLELAFLKGQSWFVNMGAYGRDEQMWLLGALAQADDAFQFARSLGENMQSFFAARQEIARRKERVARPVPPPEDIEELARSLKESLHIPDQRDAIRTLAVLLPAVPANRRNAMVSAAYTAALSIAAAWDRADALVALAPFLKGRLAQDLLERALELPESAGFSVSSDYLRGQPRAAVLAAAAPVLRGKAREQGLRESLALGKGAARTHALIAYYAVLNQDQRGHLLPELRSEVHGRLSGSQSRLYPLLIRWLEPEERSHVCRELIESVGSESPAGAVRPEELESLSFTVPLLSSDDRQYAINAALFAAEHLPLFYDESPWDSFCILAPCLDDEAASRAANLIERRWEQARTLGLGAPTVAAIAAIAARLPHPRASSILDHAFELEGALAGPARADAAIALLPVAADPLPLLARAREIIVRHLTELTADDRGSLLRFLARAKLAPPVLSGNTLARLANQVAEICFDWEWI